MDLEVFQDGHRDDMEYRLVRKRQEMKEMEQARLQKKTRSNREDR